MGLSSTRRDFLEQYITKKQFTIMGEKTTVCCITVYNGHEIIGTSACLDPKDFNADIGELLSYERALEEMNKFFGFLEQDRKHLYHGKN
jgi:hypothetical protein